MICPICHIDSHTYSELGLGGTELHCGSCKRIIPRIVEPVAAVKSGNAAGLEVIATQPASLVTKLKAESDVNDIIVKMRDRLTYLESRIAEASKFEAEAGQLRRMLEVVSN